MPRAVFAGEGPWFRERPGLASGGGEDTDFTERARERGFRLGVALDVTCGHVGLVNITPELARRWGETHPGHAWWEA